jgi:hypothetical protein
LFENGKKNDCLVVVVEQVFEELRLDALPVAFVVVGVVGIVDGVDRSGVRPPAVVWGVGRICCRGQGPDGMEEAKE